MRIRHWILLSLLLIISKSFYSQETSMHLSPKQIQSFMDAVDARLYELNRKLELYGDKALRKLRKEEERVIKKIGRNDSSTSVDGFGDPARRFNEMEQLLTTTGPPKQYIPSVDTLTTAIKFLQQLKHLNPMDGELNAALTKISSLGSLFEKTERLGRFINERTRCLNDQLLSMGITGKIRRLSKQAFYADQELHELRDLLIEHKKAERKVLELLSRTTMFQNFMRKNSMLAHLFRVPGEPDQLSFGMESLAGLQTRSEVTSILEQKINNGGTSERQQIQLSLIQAQSQLSHLKNNIPKTGNINGEPRDAGLKPNSQKTKTVLERMELGINIQSQRAQSFFPVTSDIGLSLGYKLNDRGTLGIGASYKVGWGQSIQHIHITHQGLGFRSFVDWNLKGTFWLTGGYESNYRTQFRSIRQLRDLDAWQQSGLLGLSKVISFQTKFLKSTKVQLLWDFLSYQQKPATKPLMLRVGYYISK